MDGDYHPQASAAASAMLNFPNDQQAHMYNTAAVAYTGSLQQQSLQQHHLLNGQMAGQYQYQLPHLPSAPAEEPPTRARKAKRRKNGCFADTDAGPTWWSEQDKAIIGGVIAQEMRVSSENRYDRDPPYDWSLIAPEGMSATAAQHRYKQLVDDIPRRRTNSELANICMKNYYHALIRGKVLTTEQFSRIAHMRRQPGKLKAKDLYPGIPKKPMSAFLLWAQDNREQVANAIDSRQAKHIQKALSERWRELSPEQKQPYQSAATENMSKYYTDMAAFYENNPHAKRDRKLKGVPIRNEDFVDGLGHDVAPIQHAVPPPRTGMELYTEDLKRTRQHDQADESEIVQQAAQEWHGMPSDKQAEYHRRLEDLWKDYESHRLRRTEEEQMHHHQVQQMQQMQHHQHQQHQQHYANAQLQMHPSLMLEDPNSQNGLQLDQPLPKPPPKPTAYKIFVEERREMVANSIPAGEKKTVQAKLREIWKGMTNKDRKPYKKKARIADDEYLVDMAEYQRLYGPLLAAQDQGHAHHHHHAIAHPGQGEPVDHQLLEHQHQQMTHSQMQQHLLNPHHMQQMQHQHQQMLHQSHLQQQHLDQSVNVDHGAMEPESPLDDDSSNHPVSVPANDHPQQPQAPELPSSTPPAAEHRLEEPPM